MSREDQPAAANPTEGDPPYAGRVLDGRYRVEGVIGMGGMGAVYQGRHVSLKKRVAIKILHPDVENLDELSARFEREAVAGAHVSHPNVAAATDFGELPDGSRFLVMEFARGVSLRKILQGEPLGMERSVRIARQIAAGLDAIHKKEIVHRDLKPLNVMVDAAADDFVKIIDFGVAKVDEERLSSITSRPSGPQERLTGTGVIFGTIAYVAPESAAGMEAIGPPADLYSLGLMLYEMLTGKHPFDEIEPAALFSAQCKTVPPPFYERAPDREIAPVLEAITQRLLKKDPADRYPSAAAVVEALDRVIPPPRHRSYPAITPSSLPPPNAESTPVLPKKLHIPAPKMPTGVSRALPTDEREEDTPKRPVPLPKPNPPPRRLPKPTPPPRKPAPVAKGAKSNDAAARPRMRATKPEPPRRNPPLSERGAPARVATTRAAPASRHPWRFYGGVAGASLFAAVLWWMRDPSPEGVEAMNDGIAADAATSTAPTASGAAPALPPPAVPPPATAVADDVEDAAVADAEPAPPSEEVRALRARIVRRASFKAWGPVAKDLVELATLDPASFREAAIADIARRAAIGAPATSPAAAESLLVAFAEEIGEPGPDILLAIVENGGTSKAAKRATQLLRKAEVLAKASEAARVAFDLRDAPCNEKLDHLGRAEEHGDERALVALEISVRPCFTHPRRVDEVIERLKERLGIP